MPSDKELTKEEIQNYKTTQLAVSQLAGTLVGAAIDGDAGATTGYHIATSAEEYNRQLHEKEIQFIKSKSKEYAIEYNIDESEAQKLFYAVGKSIVDERDNKDLNKQLASSEYLNKYLKIENGIASTKEQLNEIRVILTTESKGMQFKSVDSPYLDYDKNQDYFTATEEQYKNHTLYPYATVGGMQDDLLTVIPGARILKTTSKAGTTISKVAINKADDLYLKTGIKADNYIQSKVVPNVKYGYYGGMNYAYQPENAIKIIGGIEVVNDIVNDSMPPSTAKGQLYNLFDKQDSFIKGIETILEEVK